jgi:hypothetical protein
MDEGVLEAARAIRPYLPSLVGPAAAAGVDQQIARLLALTHRDEDVVAALRSLLERHEVTGDFLTEVLADAPLYRPPHVQPGYMRPTERGTNAIQPLPGDVGLIPGISKYVCPYGDYTWYRPSVGVPVQTCPTHAVNLVPF